MMSDVCGLVVGEGHKLVEREMPTCVDSILTNTSLGVPQRYDQVLCFCAVLLVGEGMRNKLVSDHSFGSLLRIVHDRTLSKKAHGGSPA